MRLIAFLCSLFGRDQKKNFENKDEDYEGETKESKALRVWIKKEKEENCRKIQEASRLLVGKSWRDPDGKEAFVRKVYKGKAPDCLCYAVGDLKPSGDEAAILIALLWDKQDPNSLGLEFCQSKFAEIGKGLRIHNPKNFAAEIVVAGTRCPLYQTGYQASRLCVNFLTVYENLKSEALPPASLPDSSPAP